MTLELSDLLLEKPISLIYWELGSDFKNFFSFLEKESEIRTLKTLEDFHHWINAVEIKNFIAGVKTSEKLKEINQILEKLPIEKRREIFVIFISPELKSLDTRASFLYSANLVVNEGDLPNMEKIYDKARTFWLNLYKPYYQTWNKLMEEGI
ncbi:MAG: hypothetical protein ABWJ99_06320 [Caldimicrobium sp.]